MKKLLYKFALVLAACCFVAVACDKDEEEEVVTPTPDPEVPDEPEVTGYDVYFPEQTVAFTFAADEDVTPLTLEVCRVNTEGEITVPVELTARGVFTLSDLVFADGEDSADLTLTLTETEAGEYSCTLTISSDYAATSADKATELTVTVTVEAEEEPEPEPEPEPDYSVSVSDVSVQPSEDAPEYISATVTLGEDVAYALVALVAGTEFDAASVTGDDVTESGTVYLALPEESGTYSVVAVAYADGEVKGSDSASLTYTAPEPEEEGPDFEVPEGWTYLGMAEYTDVIMVYVYSADTAVNASETYEVPILEKDDTHGLFRLVNPYGKYYPHTSESEYDADNDYYFEINATVYDEVYFEKQDIGAIYNGSHVSVQTLAARFVELGTSKNISNEKPYNELGTLDGEVIIFPAESMYDGPNMLFYVGDEATPEKVTTTAQFKLVLPDGYTY